jgi:hypothetical protein
MANPISGKRGRVYIDASANGTAAATPVANLNTWGLDSTTDKTEVTAFGDLSKVYVVGNPDGAISFAGYWDTAAGSQYGITNSVAAGRKFYLYPDSTNAAQYFFGQAHFDLSITQNVSGAVEISGTGSAASTVSSVGT